MQTFVVAGLVGQGAVVTQFDGSVQETRLAYFCLLLVFSFYLFAHLQKRQRGSVSGNKQVAQMCGQTRYEIATLVSLLQHFVEQEQSGWYLAGHQVLYELEVILYVEHIEVLAYILIGEFSLGETNHLVKDGQGVTHATIGFLCYEAQSFRVGLTAFLLCHILQMLNDVLIGDSLEIIYLTAAQNGRKDTMLLGGGQDEDDVRGRFFQSL